MDPFLLSEGVVRLFAARFTDYRLSLVGDLEKGPALLLRRLRSPSVMDSILTLLLRVSLSGFLFL